jgi:hypothetical protein
MTIRLCRDDERDDIHSSVTHSARSNAANGREHHGFTPLYSEC